MHRVFTFRIFFCIYRIIQLTRPGRFSETFQVFVCPISLENEAYPPPGFRKPGGSIQKFMIPSIPAPPSSKKHVPRSSFPMSRKTHKSSVINYPSFSFFPDLGFCHLERSAVSASGGRNLNPIKSNMEIPRRSLRRFPRNDIGN